MVQKLKLVLLQISHSTYDVMRHGCNSGRATHVKDQRRAGRDQPAAGAACPVCQLRWNNERSLSALLLSTQYTSATAPASASCWARPHRARTLQYTALSQDLFEFAHSAGLCHTAHVFVLPHMDIYTMGKLQVCTFMRGHQYPECPCPSPE